MYRTVVPHHGGIRCTLAARRELAAADVGAVWVRGCPQRGRWKGWKRLFTYLSASSPQVVGGLEDRGATGRRVLPVPLLVQLVCVLVGTLV